MTLTKRGELFCMNFSRGTFLGKLFWGNFSGGTFLGELFGGTSLGELFWGNFFGGTFLGELFWGNLGGTQGSPKAHTGAHRHSLRILKDFGESWGNLGGKTADSLRILVTAAHSGGGTRAGGNFYPTI